MTLATQRNARLHVLVVWTVNAHQVRGALLVLTAQVEAEALHPETIADAAMAALRSVALDALVAWTGNVHLVSAALQTFNVAQEVDFPRQVVAHRLRDLW